MAEPKHRQIFAYLEREIRSGRLRAGQQLPTELALVEKFGVSRPTVSRAMLDLTSQGLITRRPGAGTYVLDRPIKQGTATLGMIVPELGFGDIFDPICAQIVRRAQHLELGLIMGDAVGESTRPSDGLGRLAVSPENAERACDSFARHRVSGVFFTPISGAGADVKINQRIVRHLTESGIAVVLIDRDLTPFPNRSEYDLVAIDHLRGQYLATQHMLDAGWQRIIYLQWPGCSDSLNKRIAGYRACLIEDETGKRAAIVVHGDPRDLEFVCQVLKQYSPDAFLCENDLIATHLMQTLGRLELSVPSDVGVVGFNDLGMARHLETPLTTVRQPCQEIGNAAVDTMIWRLENRESPARTMLVDPQLVIRGSSVRRG